MATEFKLFESVFDEIQRNDAALFRDLLNMDGEVTLSGDMKIDKNCVLQEQQAFAIAQDWIQEQSNDKAVKFGLWTKFFKALEFVLDATEPATLKSITCIAKRCRTMDTEESSQNKRARCDSSDSEEEEEEQEEEEEEEEEEEKYCVGCEETKEDCRCQKCVDLDGLKGCGKINPVGMRFNFCKDGCQMKQLYLQGRIITTD